MSRDKCQSITVAGMGWYRSGEGTETEQKSSERKGNRNGTELEAIKRRREEKSVSI